MLRDGSTINATIGLGFEHLYRYTRNDGTIVYCLLSANAERLLLQLIKDKAMAPNLEIADPGKLLELNPDSKKSIHSLLTSC